MLEWAVIAIIGVGLFLVLRQQPSRASKQPTKLIPTRSDDLGKPSESVDADGVSAAHPTESAAVGSNVQESGANKSNVTSLVQWVC